MRSSLHICQFFQINFGVSETLLTNLKIQDGGSKNADFCNLYDFVLAGYDVTD